MVAAFFLPLILALHSFAQTNPMVTQQNNDPQSVSIELRLLPGQLKDSGVIYCMPVEYIYRPKNIEEVVRTNNGRLHFICKVEGPTFFNFRKIAENLQAGYLAEQGDEVVISSGDGRIFHFSGKDADKYRLQYELDSLSNSIPKVNNKTGAASFYLDSLQEYFAFTKYYKQRVLLALPLFDRYKGRVSGNAYRIIRDNYIRSSVKNIVDKFNSLNVFGLSRKKVPDNTLVKIYDTSYSKAVEELLSYAIDKSAMELRLRTFQIQRAYSFDAARMPGDGEITLLMLKDGIKTLKGPAREQHIVNALPDAMSNLGFTPEIEKILAGYYAESTYPEWKKWMREEELKIRTRQLGAKAPGFTLNDHLGRSFTNNDIKGKLAILHFEADGIAVNNPLQRPIEKFRNDPLVVFVNISTEKDNATWRKRILSKQGKAKNVVYVYTGGMGANHPVIRDYVVSSSPAIWVIDSSGKVINASPAIDFTKDNGDKLAVFIQEKINYYKAEHQKAISMKKDGPYVFHKDNAITAFSVDNNHIARVTVEKNGAQQLKVQTDLDKTFSINLQSSVGIQPSIYPAAEKLIAFSDIEGNLDAFRKLLQNNKVIDENFIWTFGKGHLVFAGDMFDRGNQVTECLWLMYSLEEKAKAAGGYVHFVLGNHEIMNMQGNHYYATKKYKTNATLLGKTLTELYNEDSELGRWLRTKNVIEKIGDLLFVHGGISPEVNRLSLGVEDINRIARPYYGTTIDSSNTILLTLYNSKYGEKYRISPFWSRGYYKKKSNGLISNQQLDSTLAKFNVRKIVTGHTIIADTVSVHYNGKVINTDTPHADGKSEALLIEGDRFYRVNAEGKKVLLFSDDKKRPSVK